MGKLIIQKPGLLTTIQDFGRSGYRRYGVPVSGAMDRQSAGLANLLVNNEQDQALLEITMNGPQILFDASPLIALTGADLHPMLDGRPVTMNTPILVSKGQVLSFGKPVYGTRTYLAVHGGLKAPWVLSSQSQYYPVTAASRLQSGDAVAVHDFADFPQSHASLKINKAHFSTNLLDAYPGPEFELLKVDKQELIKTESFHIGGNDRMGYQLQTEKDLSHNLDIITSPVIPGTVQLTPSGTLIVLMRDGQVTGGYPRILQLTEESLNVLSQKAHGMTVSFLLHIE